jgi:hypothetical protein
LIFPETEIVTFSQSISSIWWLGGLHCLRLECMRPQQLLR